MVNRPPIEFSWILPSSVIQGHPPLLSVIRSWIPCHLCTSFCSGHPAMSWLRPNREESRSASLGYCLVSIWMTQDETNTLDMPSPDPNPAFSHCLFNLFQIFNFYLACTCKILEENREHHRKPAFSHISPTISIQNAVNFHHPSGLPHGPDGPDGPHASISRMPAGLIDPGMTRTSRLRGRETLKQ